MHIVTKKMALMLAALTIATSCKLNAAECKKQITRHLHYNSTFPKPGLFLALQGLILQQQEKTACSTCHAGQTQTTLTPEATTLCQECFKHERMKYFMVPS